MLNKNQKQKLQSFFRKTSSVLDTAATISRAITTNQGNGLLNTLALSTIATREIAKKFTPDSFHTVFIPGPISTFLQEHEAVSHPDAYIMAEVENVQLIYRWNNWYVDSPLSIPPNFKTMLGKRVWDFYGPRIRLGLSEDSITFMAERDVDILESQEAIDIAERVKKFGSSRSVLLKGPPGTGKSTISRYLGARMCGTTLFVDPSAMRVSSWSVRHTIRYLKPTTIIFDDLDRLDTKNFLDFFEELKQHSTLIIATINDQNSVESALLRPGRFDEVFEITRIMSASALSELPPQVLEEVKYWPVAYVRELELRVKALGVENIQREFEDLKNRLPPTHSVKSKNPE